MDKIRVEIPHPFNQYIYEGLDGSSYICGDNNSSKSYEKYKIKLPHGKWKVDKIGRDDDNKLTVILAPDVKSALKDFLL